MPNPFTADHKILFLVIAIQAKTKIAVILIATLAILMAGCTSTPKPTIVPTATVTVSPSMVNVTTVTPTAVVSTAPTVPPVNATTNVTITPTKAGNTTSPI